MTFEIYSDIPAPVVTRVGRPGVEYPFAALQVGQSFFVALEGDEKKTVLNRVRTKAQRFKATLKPVAVSLRITALNDPFSGVPSIGVWRLA